MLMSPVIKSLNPLLMSDGWQRSNPTAPLPASVPHLGTQIRKLMRPRCPLLWHQWEVQPRKAHTERLLPQAPASNHHKSHSVSSPARCKVLCSSVLFSRATRILATMISHLDAVTCHSLLPGLPFYSCLFPLGPLSIRQQEEGVLGKQFVWVRNSVSFECSNTCDETGFLLKNIDPGNNKRAEHIGCENLQLTSHCGWAKSIRQAHFLELTKGDAR